MIVARGSRSHRMLCLGHIWYHFHFAQTTEGLNSEWKHSLICNFIVVRGVAGPVSGLQVFFVLPSQKKGNTLLHPFHLLLLWLIPQSITGRLWWKGNHVAGCQLFYIPPFQSAGSQQPPEMPHELPKVPDSSSLLCCASDGKVSSGEHLQS